MKTLKQFIKENTAIKEIIHKTPHGAEIGNIYNGLSPEQYKDQQEINSKFDSKHLVTINDYKKDSYYFNNALREAPDDYIHSDQSKNRINRMDEITGHPLKHDYLVRRSFGEDMGVHITNLKPGQEFMDHGYASTTLHQRNDFHSPPIESELSPSGHLHHFGLIHVPAGTKGHFLDLPGRNHQFKSEHELLLHRGTKFKVLGHHIEKVGLKTFHVTHLQVSGQEPKEIK